ncbi:hypothetical protein GDO81_010264 [Engystomops pustulosus]|uniref:Uncharacterized protein n=1 Tax=Engystomops pustulosus TaxID=76066 RepID=A0AAV7BZT6_ENGPU|nr:hypothetical protein GDO81_010264 [Engystomops pustulosus]
MHGDTCTLMEGEYTFHSEVHHTWSHIDYILVSEPILHKIVETNIEQLIISDHSPITMTIAENHMKGDDYVWRFPTYLVKDDQFVQQLKGWWTEYEFECSTSQTSPALYWDSA